MTEQNDVAMALEVLRRRLESEPSVRLAYLFGSAARGTDRPGSDIDLAVLFEPQLPIREEDILRERLESEVGRPVDLVRLASAPPLLLREVLREGRVLVARTEEERAVFELRALNVYLDTEHLRRVQRSYLHERARGRRAAQA